MLRIKAHGDFKHINTFFQRIKELFKSGILNKYGEQGVEALKEATPVDTGETAASWSYRIEHHNRGSSIIWENSNIENGACVALLIQYGHATRSGTYVSGIDYINPALRPVFDRMADELWGEVTK